MGENNMGKQRVVKKTISPAELIKALQAGSITIAQAQQMFNGVILIGDYKGIAALLDIDLLVKQPLVDAEQKHILGILDGREANYDLLTLTITAAETAGTSHVGALTVPDDELWFINNVLTTVPANAVANWYCSLWTDRLGALGYGQAFHAAALAAGDHQDEFSPTSPVWLPTNKTFPLRAPGGTVFTFVLTNVTAPATVIGTFQIYGWLGKALVD